MAKAKEKPLFDPAVDYEDDLTLWAFQQADLLRLGRFAEADIPNIVEELESMGKRDRFKLEAAYRLIISHLLKWQFQPERRSRSWRVTITRERIHARRFERSSPSLKADAENIVQDVYADAVSEAVADTELPRRTFPALCPYSLQQLQNEEFFPE